jgi:hypothetical protein
MAKAKSLLEEMENIIPLVTTIEDFELCRAVKAMCPQEVMLADAKP